MAGTVLVTGGSGYIAGFIIQQLIAEGWTVRASVRSLEREAQVRNTLKLDGEPKLSFYAADLSKDEGWDAAVAGCTHVAHVASPFPENAPKNEDELIVPAREGALRVLRAAKAAGVKRVVMTSSVAAIAYGHPPRDTPFTEADWTDVSAAGVYAYPKSKTIAERAARDWIAAEGGDMEFLTINPGAVLGPVPSDDYSTSILFVKKLMDGSVPGYPRLGFAVVDVRDLADLHVKALTAPGLDGERFIASGRFMLMKDVGAVLRARLGEKAKRVPTRDIPDFVVRILALFDGSVRQVLGELGRSRAASSAHAEARLGWTMRPAEESIVDTANSLIERGLVKA